MTDDEATTIRAAHAARSSPTEIAASLGLEVSHVLRQHRELGLTPWPEQHPEAVAAREFVALARADLERQGERPTQRRIAEVVGTTDQQLSACMLGAQRRATLSLIGEWIDRWAAAGYGELELVRGPDRVTVRRVDGAG